MQETLKELLEELNNCQFESENSQEYEKTLGKAFEFLGYDVDVIGGSGDTDVLVKANLGLKSYKVDIDAKTSKNGKITEAQINWPSLKDHKEKNGSDFVVVVGPAFAGGNLEKRANEYKVALLPNEALVRLLTTHSIYPFSLDELRDLFSSTGDINSQVDDLITQNLSKRRILDNLPTIIHEMEALQDRLGYFTYDSLAGREKIEKLDFDPSDINQIIEMFRLPFINSVQAINKDQTQLILTLREKELSNLFATLASLISNSNRKDTSLSKQVGQTVIEAKKSIINDKELGTKYLSGGKTRKENRL